MGIADEVERQLDELSTYDAAPLWHTVPQLIAELRAANVKIAQLIRKDFESSVALGIAKIERATARSAYERLRRKYAPGEVPPRGLG
ncbi:hypothetical protein [Mycobacterium intracellulare]|uniref:Uncharacterized protein n=1 Tax=Mycobacterium intracellulare TaxID=1767 RepID=A0AAE4U231_MYCIT|nr:hypothetical protein [Mycobacterium intracellulare]MDV6975307.1 hypothetical protein [Mycobacterium intracellulare]MDV6980371.1 hypothetical protein [Mycobacterium intracellulare]MDV7010800.1 hypothetical protein [Mycobacterium intracellulare]MDV7025706.1 hypothetical protein [Mycobacterium intracellulare]